MTRLPILVVLLIALGGCADAERLVRNTVGTLPVGAAMEPGIDRPGSDYRNFDVNNAGPAACQRACEGDATCRAWTHTEPGMQAPGGMCWLKDAVPAPVRTPGMTSGVMRSTGSAGSTGSTGAVVNVAGRWDSDWSDDPIVLRQTGTQVTGTYDNQRGAIEGTLRGNVLEGYYIGPSSRQCDTARNGSRTWGRIRFTFVSNDRWEGRYGYCDDAVTESSGPWEGTRIR
jgi:hypothetical protein